MRIQAGLLCPKCELKCANVNLKGVNEIYSRYFCPDGSVVPIEKCLKKCRMKERCLSHRTLLAISEQREWTGKPSATQLLSGTREEYLKLKKDYIIDPQGAIFAIFGTGCHAFLEQFLENDDMVAEKRLTDPTGTYTGQFDCYDGKRGILYDVKTYGSYKTARAMGLVKHKEVMRDKDGVPMKYKNGKLKYKVWFERGVRHLHDVAIQLNAYRMMIENLGYPVNEMVVEIFTRDAGTYSARDRGVDTNMQLVKVNHISDHWVQKYMLTKAKRLVEAMEKDKLPPPCRNVETWNGRKCLSYCDVWWYCDKGRKAHEKR